MASPRNIPVETIVSLMLLAVALPAAAKDKIILNRLGPTTSELFIANADGTGERKLLSTSEMDYSASFSRDGKWIVFTSERKGSDDIFRVHPDDSREPGVIAALEKVAHVVAYKLWRHLNSRAGGES